MNKRGFTLIELLAVIIILSLLTLITSTAITKILKDSKQELSDMQLKSIESSAKAWGADNIDRLPSIGDCSYITLGTLNDYGMISSDIIDPKTNQQISDELNIKITTTASKSGNPVVSYEVDADDILECTYIGIPCGDVNLDGTIDQDDVTLINQYLADYSGNYNSVIRYGDVNGDGIVDLLDSAKILQYIEDSSVTFSCRS